MHSFNLIRGGGQGAGYGEKVGGIGGGRAESGCWGRIGGGGGGERG